jgi:quercetin 2,3-dioxygenase
MTIKKVQQILPPAPAHMVGDGFKVHNFFPSGYNISNRRMSPFFMLDYNAQMELSPSETPRGVGVHPHRGFETVTIAYKGAIAHGDSFGNKGIVSEGEVQWMTAASGILHKEYHEEAFSKKGGLFQMVQLWVNLPAKDKMSKPKYQALTRALIQESTHHLPLVRVEVIAGNYQDTHGAASTFSPIELYNLQLSSGGKIQLHFPAEYNTGLLVIEGSVLINQTENAAQDHFALFENVGTDIILEASTDARVLVLSGEPINEPIASYGPFLMNSQEEIRQAVIDFNSGKFGYLAD